MFCYVLYIVYCYITWYLILFYSVMSYFAGTGYYWNIKVFSQFYGCTYWKNHGNQNLWCHETWLATPHPISSCQVFSLRHSAQEIWSHWSRWSHCSLRLLFTGDSEDSDHLVEDFEDDDSEVFKDSEDLLEGSVRPSIVFTSGFAGPWLVSR